MSGCSRASENLTLQQKQNRKFLIKSERNELPDVLVTGRTKARRGLRTSFRTLSCDDVIVIQLRRTVVHTVVADS